MDSATTMTFIVALQASIVLGLLHGISPCGHSWPMLAPFCITAKSMRKCINVWFFFCLGTTVACLVLGVIFGMLGSFIPPSWDIYFGIGTACILVVLGVVIIFKPHWLHFEDEEEEEALKKSLDSTEQALQFTTNKRRFKHGIYWGMFSIGFINMIIPCPTAAVMYTYALVAKSVPVGTTIFLAYALATSLVLLIITYSLGKATLFFKKLGQEKYEVLITRISGAFIAGFGVYMIIVESKPLFQ
ncbi:MAG: sulfite exporter TauE/SafE family protein [Deltaproteobacteria bacterium]|nr:sulfite exporter TauE/SafE family protein [Deltaproteobacteria bacterium]